MITASISSSTNMAIKKPNECLKIALVVYYICVFFSVQIAYISTIYISLPRESPAIPFKRRSIKTTIEEPCMTSPNPKTMMIKEMTTWKITREPSVTTKAKSTSAVVTPATILRSKVPSFLSLIYAIPPVANGTKKRITINAAGAIKSL